MNIPFQNIPFRPEATIVRALIPARTPGTIALHLSDGTQGCIGLGGACPGLHAGLLRGLTEDDAREAVERWEAAHARAGLPRRPREPRAERPPAPQLILEDG